jgi:hypothetical protein
MLTLVTQKIPFGRVVRPMASKENKRKYVNKEEEMSTVTSKQRWARGDDNDDDGDNDSLIIGGGDLFRGGTHSVTSL